MARNRLTRAESRQRTREALVSAAVQVFARDGYAGASVDAIAEQAGYTVGALYSNFATKQALFMAAFERHCASDLDALRALIEATGTRGELLAAVAERFTDLDTAHREWWQLWAELWLYAQRHPEAADQLVAVQDETRAVIADALGRGAERLEDELVAVIHALWTGFMMYRLINPRALEASAFARAAGWLIAGQAPEQTTNPTGRTRTTSTKQEGMITR
jgi:AcrR family transcriptional regulator